MGRFFLVTVFFIGCSAWAQGVTDLLPDMIVNPERLADHEIRTDIKPNRVFLTLSNGTANIGDGALEIRAVKPGSKHDEQVQKVKQRIYRSDGSHYARPAGYFVYHPEHDHIHFEGWAVYRLRTVLPNNGVGDVVAEGEKTSFCLLDSFVYDATNPGFKDEPKYVSCNATAQGISAGYEDVYSKSLPDQWIEITALPEGEYWLESEVDPENHVLEKDETNNVARIKITITFGDPNPDPDPSPSGILAAFVQFLQDLLAYLRSIVAVE